MICKIRQILQKSHYKTEKLSMASVKTKDVIRTVIKPPKRAADKPPVAPNKLMLLVTVVNRKKAEFYIDLLQAYDVNLQLDVSAFGTAPPGLQYVTTDPEKQVIFTVVRQDQAKNALSVLEEKFQTIRGGKGIAFTVPFTSTIGVSVYQFLTNIQ